MNFLGGTDATEADFETVSGEQAAYLSIGHRAILPCLPAAWLVAGFVLIDFSLIFRVRSKTGPTILANQVGIELGYAC